MLCLSIGYLHGPTKFMRKRASSVSCWVSGCFCLKSICFEAYTGLKSDGHPAHGLCVHVGKWYACVHTNPSPVQNNIFKTVNSYIDIKIEISVKTFIKEMPDQPQKSLLKSILSQKWKEALGLRVLLSVLRIKFVPSLRVQLFAVGTAWHRMAIQPGHPTRTPSEFKFIFVGFS